MLVGMNLGRFFMMVGGMKMMTVGDVGMVRRFFMIATKCLLNNQCLQHVLSRERTFPQVVAQPSKHGRSTNCLHGLEKLSRTSVVTVPILSSKLTPNQMRNK